VRKLIVVVTLVVAPLAAAAPAAAAAADREGTGSDDAAVVTVGSARQDLSDPPIASPAPQARQAVTTQHSAATKSGRRHRGAAPASPRRRPRVVGVRRGARGARRPGVRRQRLGPGAAGIGLTVRSPRSTLGGGEAPFPRPPRPPPASGDVQRLSTRPPDCKPSATQATRLSLCHVARHIAAHQHDDLHSWSIDRG